MFTSSRSSSNNNNSTSILKDTTNNKSSSSTSSVISNLFKRNKATPSDTNRYVTSPTRSAKSSYELHTSSTLSSPNTQHCTKRSTLTSLSGLLSSKNHSSSPNINKDVIIRSSLHNDSNLSRSSFNLLNTLGTGTFGRVRLVTYNINNNNNNNNNQSYTLALKMLKKSEIIRLKQLDHIKNEKNILTQIATQCPYIVNLYHTFSDINNIYFVMEYVNGGELFTLLRRQQKFNEAYTRFYAAEILVAIEYLHNHNIIYRDLKPENLLIDKDGHIKITDFGFAKIVYDRTWTLCGTPEYLAPEIIQSKGHDKSVDYWSFGILLYEMLAGFPPFSDDNPMGIYTKIISGNIEYPKHFTRDSIDLINKLLQLDRSKRLGNLHNGISDIKNHKFFEGIDWDKIKSKKVIPLYKPVIKHDKDTSNFDTYPESDDESHNSSNNMKPTLSKEDQALFNDF